jgi:vacuolar-type H+-ATPase subunit F/Vma7
MINKFDIDFERPEYGWLYFSILKDKKPMIGISASGVYNPFEDYVDIVYDLKHNRKKKLEFIIDQEGFDARIIFISRGIYVYIETETLTENTKRRKHLLQLPLPEGRRLSTIKKL